MSRLIMTGGCRIPNACARQDLTFPAVVHNMNIRQIEGCRIVYFSQGAPVVVPVHPVIIQQQLQLMSLLQQQFKNANMRIAQNDTMRAML